MACIQSKSSQSRKIAESVLTIGQIIEELSAGADEQMEPLREKIEDLELANQGLRKEISELKAKPYPAVSNGP